MQPTPTYAGVGGQGGPEQLGGATATQSRRGLPAVNQLLRPPLGTTGLPLSHFLVGWAWTRASAPHQGSRQLLSCSPLAPWPTLTPCWAKSCFLRSFPTYAKSWVNVPGSAPAVLLWGLLAAPGQGAARLVPAPRRL